MLVQHARLIGMIKAYQLWFHSAHHVTKGTGFSSDHNSLYGKIYQDTLELFDEAVEKAVGITDIEDLACPIKISRLAFERLQGIKTPSNCDNVNIALTAVHIADTAIGEVEEIFKIMDDNNTLTLGMNDYLGALANTMESHLYLLKQRVKDTTHGR